MEPKVLYSKFWYSKFRFSFFIALIIVSTHSYALLDVEDLFSQQTGKTGIQNQTGWMSTVITQTLAEISTTVEFSRWFHYRFDRTTSILYRGLNRSHRGYWSSHKRFTSMYLKGNQLHYQLTTRDRTLSVSLFIFSVFIASIYTLLYFKISFMHVQNSRLLFVSYSTTSMST